MAHNPFKKHVEQNPNNECAPHIKQVAKGVCSDPENIESLRKWLETTVRDPKKIVESALAQTGCGDESCLYVKVPVLDKSDLDERFNPKGPWNSTAWLSNTDIDDVLALYAQKFPKFKHIEFEMRDFASRNTPLANLEMPIVAKRYDSLGCVLNTDVSGGPGEHWTALYIDFVNGTVEYFDSAAQPPHKEFLDFAVTTANMLTLETGKKFMDMMVTKVEHQKENTECGVYSLFYILSRLHGAKPSAFEYDRVPDEHMVEFRKFLFRHE